VHQAHDERRRVLAQETQWQILGEGQHRQLDVLLTSPPASHKSNRNLYALFCKPTCKSLKQSIGCPILQAKEDTLHAVGFSQVKEILPTCPLASNECNILDET
jgi:hypothetical protein